MRVAPPKVGQELLLNLKSLIEGNPGHFAGPFKGAF
jgi:hypothetical protein